MLKPLSIGKVKFPNNLIQGPLAGVSCAPFRLLTWKNSQCAFTCTEMISAKTILYHSKSKQRYLMKYAEEGPVSFQLSGTDDKEMGEAAKIVTESGASLIDLNCGCPVNKVRRKGAGSSLLMTPIRLFALIDAVKKNTHLPLTVKIRVQGDHPERFHQTIATVIEDAGADALIVHGRHWLDRYEVACHYEDIDYFVKRMSIPVIGNGDISDVTSLKRMFATGCAGAMIARAGVGQPWLIKKLQTEMSGKTFTVPANHEIGRHFIDHVKGLIDLLNHEKKAIFESRAIAKYYARTLRHKNEFCLAINDCHDFSTFKKIVSKYFCSEI